MANWNKEELTLPPEFKKIANNAQNAIDNVEILMGIIKQTGDVAKLFLALANPAGLIIKLAAEEVIKLCNDFKEIGFFWLMVDPFDLNATAQTYGLKIQQDADGNYQFKNFDPETGVITIDPQYQKTVQLKDLVLYRDSAGRKQGDANFNPPTPIFYSPRKWELGGYNASTWNGELDSVVKVPGLINVPQMTPSECLGIMSAAFDDEGDVARYKIPKGTKIPAELFTASGAPINFKEYTNILTGKTGKFDVTTLKSEPIYREGLTKAEGPGGAFTRTLTLDQRGAITEMISAGKPNFSGSSNIEGVEVLAVVALVGVSDFTQFVSAWESLSTLFAGAPNFSEMKKKLDAIKFKIDDTELGKDKMVMTNDSRYGAWTKGDFILGEDSDAVGRIDEITEVKIQKRFRDDVNSVYGEDDELLSQTVVSVDKNPTGNWKEVTTKFKLIGEVNFIAGEKVFEAIPVPDKETQRNLFAGNTTAPKTFNYIKKPLGDSAKDPAVEASKVQLGDVPKYGEILGIDVSAPPSTSPNFSSVKIKDMINGYAGFFDDIIGFANTIKSLADGAEVWIAELIASIDEYIKYFEKVANSIKAFLAIFTNLPEAGVYWLTIKTFGGNKAIQAAITGSDDAPPDTLKFTAGFLMVSVSGVGGLSSTKGLELLFGNNGLGLEFQEVAPIPEVSALDTAVLNLQTQYTAAAAAQAELATDVFDNLGLNPPVTFRDATQITFTDWNGVEPNVGDYVLGTKSGAFGQILAFAVSGILVLDHIKPGPTIAGTQEDEERIVRLFDVTSGDFLEFPYAGKLVGTNGLAFDGAPDTTLTLVGEGRFSEKVLVNRSSHKPNGQGTTVYEVFQGNEGTFVKVDDVEEFVEEQEITLPANLPWNTFGQDRIVKQQVFKVINGAVKDPVLTSGHSGKYGSFTDDDTIISFGEEFAQIFLADIEGRNTEDDRVTRLKPPPQPDHDDTYEMKITVAGTGSISVTAEGGEVESIAAALNNTVNPNNLPESAQERTARERAGN